MAKGTAQELIICGCKVKLGDYMVVEYTTGERHKGAQISGTVTELWSEEDHPGGCVQGQLNNGWCFHDNDKIITHQEANDD